MFRLEVSESDPSLPFPSMSALVLSLSIWSHWLVVVDMLVEVEEQELVEAMGTPPQQQEAMGRHHTKQLVVEVVAVEMQMVGTQEVLAAPVGLGLEVQLEQVVARAVAVAVVVVGQTLLVVVVVVVGITASRR